MPTVGTRSTSRPTTSALDRWRPTSTFTESATCRSYRKLGPGPTSQKLLRVDPALTLLLRRLLRSRSFDIIHAHHFEGLLVGAAARVGLDVPLVFDAHTLLMSELPYYSLGPAGVSQSGHGPMDGSLDAAVSPSTRSA